MGSDGFLLQVWKITVFVILISVIAFAQLLPLSREAGALPGPDLMFLVIAAYAIRRPRMIPTWVYLVVLMVADILLMRPLGLHAAITLVAIDMIRRRGMQAPTMPFLREWLIVATSVTAITLLEVVILTLFLVPQASLGLALIHLIVTVLTYPVVVALVAQPFGLRRPKSGDRNLIVGRPA